MPRRFRLSPLLWTAVATLAASLAAGPASAVAAPQSETVYIDGHTAEINTGAGVIFNAAPALLDQASPIYIIGFPVAPGTEGPITLPSGYEPQHNGFPPAPIPYHDHVITDPNNVRRRVVEMSYSWTYAYSADFAPITSADEIAAAEADGRLAIVNPDASDPYQNWTTTVLIRPLVHAS